MSLTQRLKLRKGNHNLRKIIIAIACIAALFLIGPVSVFTLYIMSYDSPDLPPSAQGPLIYVGAENLTRREESEFPGTHIEIVTFHSKDNPEEIFAFYREHLKQDAWILRSVGPYNERYTLVVGDASEAFHSAPTFYFEVEARAKVGRTDVEVALVTYPIR
jgi:hypothetical protein